MTTQSYYSWAFDIFLDSFFFNKLYLNSMNLKLESKRLIYEFSVYTDNILRLHFNFLLLSVCYISIILNYFIIYFTIFF